MKLQEVGKLSGGRQSCCEPEANVRVAAAPFGQPPAAGGPTKLAGGGGRVQAPARHQLDGLLLLCERANELAQKEEQLRRERQLDAGGWRHCDQAQEQEQGSGDEEQEEEEEEEEEDGKSSLGPRQTAKTRTIFSCMWPNCTKNCDSIEAIECHVRHHLGLMQYDHTYGDEDFYYEETEVDEPTYFAIFRAQQPAAPMASDGRGHHQSQQAMSPSQHSDGFSSAQSPASSSSPAGSPRNCPPASAAAAAAAPSAPPQPPIESVAGGSQTATATAAGVPPCRLATLADLSAHRRKWPAPPIEIGRDQRRHHHHHQHHQLQQQQQAAADRPIDWAHFLGSNPKRPQGGELAAAAAAANDQETMMLMLMMSQKKRQLNGAYKGAAGATGRRPSASSSASSLESAGSSLSSASAALISASSSRRHSTRSASRHKRHRCHEASCGSDEEQDEDDEEEDEEEEQQQQQSCDGQQDDELGVRHNSEQQTAADSLWALQFPMELADGRDDTTPPTSPPQVPPARDSTAGRQSYCAAIEHAYCSPPANADEPPPPLPPPPQLERRARKQPQPKHQQLQPKAAPNSSGQNQRLRRQPMEVAHDNHHHLHLRLLSTHHKQQHHHQHQQFFQQIKPNYTNTISSYSSTSGNTKACGKLLIDSIDVNTSNNNNKHNDIGNSNLSLLGGSKTATSTASTHHHRIKSASHSSNSDSWSEDSAASSSAASEAPSSSPPQSASKRVRGENKKCRKVYGMEQRGLWCTQCKWKKACSRFCD